MTPIWLRPYPLVGSGAVLFVLSFLLPKSRSKSANGLMVQKGSEILLPEKWDEHRISLDIERYRGEGGALGTYLQGIVTRFVVGQKARTVESRIQFLQSFNRYAEVAREAYKWKRYMEGDRAQVEEDVEDIQAQVKLAKAEADLAEAGGDAELLKLQREARRLEVQLEIAQRKKAIEEINAPPPPPPPPSLPPPPLPPAPSAADLRRKELADLNASEKQVREQIRIVTADPTLSEEQRRRKLNALEERLDQIHEQQVRLL